MRRKLSIFHFIIARDERNDMRSGRRNMHGERGGG
jgi:hypothetical protein